MQRYIIRRLLAGVLVVIGAMVIMFVLLQLSGDPSAALAGADASAEEIAALRQRMGFDKPIYVQLGIYLSDVFRGDFQQSYRYGDDALTVVLERLPATLELTFVALFISLVVALPVGVISAVRRNTIEDQVAMIGTLLGQTMPVFWLGILLIMIFSVRLEWFPTGGRGSFKHLILPSITLAAFGTARIARLVRSAMLEVMAEDYIQVARSKGLREAIVIRRHALKNAAIPVVTIVGLQLGKYLGGAVITETVFAWPGVGRLMVQSIGVRDIPVLQAAVFIMAIIFALINLFVDVIYTFLDPRIRYG